jgi:uncharacterized SAM-binding protein YcdF (DUF218 family)
MGVRHRLKGMASRGGSRCIGAICRPLLPWLSRREGFRRLPEQLLVQASPAAADLIHVLGGAQAGPYVRVDHGVDLHLQGLAPRLLFTGCEFGIDWARRNADRALERGVAAAALILDPAPTSTLAEAAALRRVVTQAGCRTVLLVTEAFHAGRAARVMGRALEGTGVELRSCPAGAAGYPPATWWEDPLQRSLVLGEAARLCLARAMGNA